MALYFFAMYVLGASLGPVGMGFLSSHFTRKAALGPASPTQVFKRCGPSRLKDCTRRSTSSRCLGCCSAGAVAASRTVARDMEKLQRWMRESTDQDAPPEITPAEAVAPIPGELKLWRNGHAFYENGSGENRRLDGHRSSCRSAPGNNAADD